MRAPRRAKFAIDRIEAIAAEKGVDCDFERAMQGVNITRTVTMTIQLSRITTVLGALLVSTIALAAPKPFDTELLVSSSDRRRSSDALHLELQPGDDARPAFVPGARA